MFKSLTQREHEELDALRQHQEARRDHELAHARVQRHTEALIEAEEERSEAAVDRSDAKKHLETLIASA